MFYHRCLWELSCFRICLNQGISLEQESPYQDQKRPVNFLKSAIEINTFSVFKHLSKEGLKKHLARISSIFLYTVFSSKFPIIFVVKHCNHWGKNLIKCFEELMKTPKMWCYRGRRNEMVTFFIQHNNH